MTFCAAAVSAILVDTIMAVAVEMPDDFDEIKFMLYYMLQNQSRLMKLEDYVKRNPNYKVEACSSGRCGLTGEKRRLGRLRVARIDDLILGMVQAAFAAEPASITLFFLNYLHDCLAKRPLSPYGLTQQDSEDMTSSMEDTPYISISPRPMQGSPMKVQKTGSHEWLKTASEATRECTHRAHKSPTSTDNKHSTDEWSQPYPSTNFQESASKSQPPTKSTKWQATPATTEVGSSQTSKSPMESRPKSPASYQNNPGDSGSSSERLNASYNKTLTETEQMPQSPHVLIAPQTVDDQQISSPQTPVEAQPTRVSQSLKETSDTENGPVPMSFQTLQGLTKFRAHQIPQMPNEYPPTPIPHASAGLRSHRTQKVHRDHCLVKAPHSPTEKRLTQILSHQIKAHQMDAVAQSLQASQMPAGTQHMRVSQAANSLPARIPPKTTAAESQQVHARSSTEPCHGHGVTTPAQVRSAETSVKSPCETRPATLHVKSPAEYRYSSTRSPEHSHHMKSPTEPREARKPCQVGSQPNSPRHTPITPTSPKITCKEYFSDTDAPPNFHEIMFPPKPLSNRTRELYSKDFNFGQFGAALNLNMEAFAGMQLCSGIDDVSNYERNKRYARIREMARQDRLKGGIHPVRAPSSFPRSRFRAEKNQPTQQIHEHEKSENQTVDNAKRRMVLTRAESSNDSPSLPKTKDLPQLAHHSQLEDTKSPICTKHSSQRHVFLKPGVPNCLPIHETSQVEDKSPSPDDQTINSTKKDKHSASGKSSSKRGRKGVNAKSSSAKLDLDKNAKRLDVASTTVPMKLDKPIKSSIPSSLNVQPTDHEDTSKVYSKPGVKREKSTTSIYKESTGAKLKGDDVTVKQSSVQTLSSAHGRRKDDNKSPVQESTKHHTSNASKKQVQKKLPKQTSDYSIRSNSPASPETGESSPKDEKLDRGTKSTFDAMELKNPSKASLNPDDGFKDKTATRGDQKGVASSAVTKLVAQSVKKCESKTSPEPSTKKAAGREQSQAVKILRKTGADSEYLIARKSTLTGEIIFVRKKPDIETIQVETKTDKTDHEEIESTHSKRVTKRK